MPAIRPTDYTFPSAILRSGAITQLPYTAGQEYLTTRVELDVGVSYAWANRETPISKFTLAITSMTAAELLTLEDFFISVEGRLQSFSFVDPDGGSHPNCRFDTDTMTVNYLGVNEYGVSLPITEFFNPS